MSSGGTSAIRGFGFQDLVGLKYALRLLDDTSAISVQIEATREAGSDQNIFVDDIITSFRDGRQEFIQVKSSSPKCQGWTIKALAEIGELKKIIDQLKLSQKNTVVLICPHSFGDLESLISIVLQYPDVESFQSIDNDSAKKRYADFCRYSGATAPDAFQYLKRIRIGDIFREDSWKELVTEKIKKYAKSGESAYYELAYFVREHQKKTNPEIPSLLTAEIIKRVLEKHGFVDLRIERTDRHDQWDYQGTRRITGIRLIPVIAEEAKEDRWECKSPRFEMFIRPKANTGEGSVTDLIGRIKSKKLVLPSFYPFAGNRIARSAYGVHCYEIVEIPPPPPGPIRKILGMVFGKGLLREPTERFSTFTTLTSGCELEIYDTTSLFSSNYDSGRELPPNFEERFVRTLTNARATLCSLGYDEVFEVRVGMVGIGRCTLKILDDKGKISVEETPKAEDYILEMDLEVTSEFDSSLSVLKPFFTKVWENFHSVRPQHYDLI